MVNRTINFRLGCTCRSRSVSFYVAAVMMACGDASADWQSKIHASAYYTDDVALFSVTRRLSLQDDPTQPIVDRPQQGGAFVFEPNAELTWTGANAWGEIEFSADAAGYLFTGQNAYSHGLFEAKLSQKLVTDTKIQFEYNLIPDLFLGKNELIRSTGLVGEDDEQLTSHLWTGQVEQALNDQFTVRLLSRYGLREYNAPFQHRDTRLWTLGSHLEWAISPDAELLVGYHFERGYAKPNRITGFADDVSYINHYASAELKVTLAEKLSANFIFDFEKNDFTSANSGDDHFRAFETVYQGEFELLYELADAATVKLGWQHGQRKLNTELQTVRNNNIWLGVEYVF